MWRWAAGCLCAGLLAVLSFAGSQNTQQRKTPEQKKQFQRTGGVLTGCVDQDGEDYLLREPSGLSERARLEPEGFAKEGLAKFVGQTVRIRGSKTEKDGRTVVRVRSIETLAEGCSESKDR